MSIGYNKSSTEREFVRKYENMRGVDFSEVQRKASNQRYGYLENMYVDYAAGGSAVESIPGFRVLKSTGKKIHSIFSHRLGDGNEYIFVHAGTNLYRFRSDMRDSISSSWTLVGKTLNDAESHAISYGDYLLILDGNKINVVYQEELLGTLGENVPVYVPSVSVGGVADEDINLLSQSCTSQYHIKSFDDVSHASPGLTYTVVKDGEEYCEVTGIADDFSGVVYIPSYATVDGVRYKVKSIGSTAFRYNTSITELYLNDNLENICKYSFWGCTSLKKVYLSGTVKIIEHHAFYGCTALESIFVGTAFEKYEVNCFEGCSSLAHVYYAGAENTTVDIVGKDRVGNAAIHYNSPSRKYVLSIPVSPKIEDITYVTLRGVEIEYTFDVNASEVVVAISNKSMVANSTIAFTAKVKQDSSTGKFFSHTASKNIDSADAIYKCTCGTVYDGRIFLSGNPLLPGYVFYCSLGKNGNYNPFYYSANNFFVDGVGKYDITSLLSTQDNLVVFKSGDDGTGSVFYHTPEEIEGVKEYPVSYIHKGIGVSGASYNFYDDTVFLSDMGLSALERSSAGGVKRVASRSSNVNPKLFGENIKDMKVTEWCGYLVISAGGRMYLADSRDKFDSGDSYEYEWYYLNGIGTYDDGIRVFRYKPTAISGYYVHKDTDAKTSLTVKSAYVNSSGYVYYVIENGKKYEVYATDEFSGGNFSPASAVLGMNSLLYFGTESGDICVFNNDKRGVPPEHIKSAEDFDEEEYKRSLGDRIHPDFYDFASRPAKYVVATAFDDCELGDRRKSTIPSSLTVKFKSYQRSRIAIDVSTDLVESKRVGEFSASTISFSDIDFSALCLSAQRYSTLPVQEREQGWVEKRISLYSDEFRSPIGIYSIIYRYKIKGKLKLN